MIPSYEIHPIRRADDGPLSNPEGECRDGDACTRSRLRTRGRIGGGVDVDDDVKDEVKEVPPMIHSGRIELTEEGKKRERRRRERSRSDRHDEETSKSFR